MKVIATTQIKSMWKSIVLSQHGTGKLSLSPWHPKCISHYFL